MSWRWRVHRLAQRRKLCCHRQIPLRSHILVSVQASSTYTPVGVTWNQVSNIIKSQVEAAMCGINPDGLAASQFERISDSFRQRTAGEVVWTHAYQRLLAHVCGLQQWSTCWDKTYRSRFNLMSVADFYAASVNWFDITCRNGDGMFGGHRQPCTWFWFVTL